MLLCQAQDGYESKLPDRAYVGSKSSRNGTRNLSKIECVDQSTSEWTWERFLAPLGLHSSFIWLLLGFIWASFGPTCAPTGPIGPRLGPLWPPCHEITSCHDISSWNGMSSCHDMSSCHGMSACHAVSQSQNLFCLNLDALAVPEALVNSFRILTMLSTRLNPPQLQIRPEKNHR